MNVLALAPYPAPATDENTLRRVLGWMPHQPAEVRARAISALARAYLSASLSASARADALVAMTAALDDCASSVRRALAEALAGTAAAPRHLVAALAIDRAEVAAPLLAHSPLVDDSLLAEAARHGGASEQTTIARRPDLGPRAIATIAELGQRPAALALVANARAAVPPEGLRILFDRFRDDAGMREALIARGGLPAALRVDLAVAGADALVELGKGWLEGGRADRLKRDTREQAIVTIARERRPDEMMALVEHLRTQGYLTVGLLVRGLLCGDLALFEAAMASLSGVPMRRVAGFVADWRGRGFAAIYAKTGLQEAFLPAFRAVLGALRAIPDAAGEGVRHRVALRAIEDCEAARDPRLEPIVSLLWRLAGEGAREEAQQEMLFAVSEANEPPALVWAEPEAPVIELLTPEADVAIDFDPIPALELELELAVAELRATYALIEAPRLDFAPNAEVEEDELAANAPKLDFAAIVGVREAAELVIDFEIADAA